MRSFIDQHRERFGVEPICKLLRVAPSAYWRYAARHLEACHPIAKLKEYYQIKPALFQKNLSIIRDTTCRPERRLPEWWGCISVR